MRSESVLLLNPCREGDSLLLWVFLRANQCAEHEAQQVSEQSEQVTFKTHLV